MTKLATRPKMIGAFWLVVAFVLGAFAFPLLNDRITDEDVRNAAELIGLQYTQQEIDSMLPGLQSQRHTYLENGGRSSKNWEAPALIFNPLPAGFTFDPEPSTIKLSPLPKLKLPTDKTDLAYLSVRELAQLIETRQITSVALTKFYIERLKNYDRKLFCVVSLLEEQALEQAKKADSEIEIGIYKGPLHGIPYGIKDLFATRSHTTSWGAMPYKYQQFDFDATVVRRLENAGAVLVTKLSSGALARGDVWYAGRTRNPWDITSGSSGSSAGSASAVAAGLVPFAIGTETMGSITSPAATCGITGLRPTFGRVSRYGAMTLAWSLDKIGPLCRNVEDCALILDAIRGADGLDPSAIDVAFPYDASMATGNLKLGYVKSAFEDDRNREQDSLLFLKWKELPFQLRPIELPVQPNLRVILDVETTAALQELTFDGTDDLMIRQDKSARPNQLRRSRFIPAVEYLNANRMRTRLIQAMDQIFKEVDVYVFPNAGGDNLWITNYTGHPTVVVPSGFEKGKPTSVALVGKLYGEATLLSVAKAFQDVGQAHLKRPVGFE